MALTQEFKNKVINYFNSNYNNSSRIIAKKLNVSMVTVETIITEHLKTKVNNRSACLNKQNYISDLAMRDQRKRLAKPVF